MDRETPDLPMPAQSPSGHREGPTTPAVTLRPLTPEHVPGVLALLQASGLPQDGFPEHVAAGLTAWAEDELVGSAALEIYGQSGLLRSVAVAAPWRHQGIGAGLTAAILELGRQRGLQQLYLLTETAVDYFTRHGFVPISRDAVEPAVQASLEFVSACPQTAQAMICRLGSPLSHEA